MGKAAGVAMMSALALGLLTASQITTGARCPPSGNCDIGNSSVDAIRMIADGGTATHDGPDSMIQVGIGVAPAATCTAGEVFIDTDPADDTNCTTVADNSLCLCLTDDNWTALNNPQEATEHWSAQLGGGTTATDMTVGSYAVMNSSMTETTDVNDCFTITNADPVFNEVCYTCADTISVQVNTSLTVERTTGGATDHLMFIFGKDGTGDIGDGDEFGGGSHITVDSIYHEMGSISSPVTLDTDDCIALMGQTNDATPTCKVTIEAFEITITEPWPGF